jgi:ribosome-binding factor A
MTQRTERVDELLRQEIGAILAREIKDPAIGFVTITDVETAPDLRHARVWVSVIGQAGERDESIVALQRAMGFVRRELGTRLRIRRIPELQVRLDDSIERGTRVLHLLDQLEAGQTPDDEPPGESLPTPAPFGHHESPEAPGPGTPNPGDDAAAAAEPGSSRAFARKPGSGAPGRGRRGGTRARSRPRPSSDRGGRGVHRRSNSDGDAGSAGR